MMVLRAPPNYSGRMKCRSGFSLVELSIVLVILGLLTGGILAGQSLIRASELRAVSTEHDRFITARSAFRDKYFQLPGDLNNAFAFWGATCGTNATTMSTGCNGDGDGTIESSGVSEDVKVWEHLSRAGIIEGSYDGTGTDLGGGYISSTPTNSPSSKFSQGIWLMTDATVSGNVAGGSSTTSYLTLAGYDAAIAPYVGLRSMTHGDAWNLDKKMDDGYADTGNMRGDIIGDCHDMGAVDIGYGISTVGADQTGDCIIHFLLR